jgi:hypothetical protein
VLCEYLDVLSELSLEELMQVSVTAQRREQAWVDVPVSLNVLTEHRLIEPGGVTLSQVASAMSCAFNSIFLAMSKIIGRVYTPFIASLMVGLLANTIQNGVAHSVIIKPGAWIGM